MVLIDTLFIIAVIIFSVIIHEVMHGVAADSLGDPTARYAGRLTLNPIPHLDMFGSILLPAMLALTNSPLLFGWAKPVPYNPFNLRPGRFSEAIVAGAGPASNLAIALLGGLVIRSGMIPGMESVIFIIVLVNVMLFLLNLIPIPPLDGSKIASAILPQALSRGYDRIRTQMEYNPLLGMGIIVLFILLLGGQFGRILFSVAQAIAGL